MVGKKPSWKIWFEDNKVWFRVRDWVGVKVSEEEVVEVVVMVVEKKVSEVEKQKRKKWSPLMFQKCFDQRKKERV